MGPCGVIYQRRGVF